jgi:hypothetical protein
MRRSETPRMELILASGCGQRQRRELGAFARYCIRRIERDLGELDHWSVTIAPSCDSKYVCTVEAVQRAQCVHSTAYGHDAVLATWNALCRLEQTLHERGPWLAYAS